MKKLNRRDFIRHASVGIGMTAAGAHISAVSLEKRDNKPNILYIFADQMRFCAMGCMGNAVVKTPHLDGLAAQGLLLENAFSCSPVCAPYRAQLMTGRYGHSTGVTENDIRLPPEEISIAEVLKGEGYATGYIGKWHLSGGRNQPWGTPERSGYVNPEDRQGWDYWAALECKHSYYDTRYYLNSSEPVLVKGYEPETQTDLAIEYLRQHRNLPFCLMLSYGPPHGPYQPPAAYDTYDPAEVPLRPNVPKDQEEKTRSSLAQYYGLVTSLDDNVNRLLQTLDELDIAEDTIVCFSSDHGDMLGSQGHATKQRPWEESIHIPFLLRYPRRIKAGQRRDTLFASVDVMPTLLGLCNVPIPAKVQGVDLSAHFLGRSNDVPALVFFANTHHDNGPGSDWRGIRTKEWMYAYAAEGDWVLYNVSEDPYELKNLIGDPAHQAKRDELRALLDTRRSELGDAAVLQGTLRNWKNRKARTKNIITGMLCAGLLMSGTAVCAAEREIPAGQLEQLLKRFPEADTDKNGILTAEEARNVVRKSRSGDKATRSPVTAKRATGGKVPANIKPDYADMSYGPFPNNKLDLWLAKADKPTPLVVFIHGGGFVGGDKSSVSSLALRQCLDADVSFAAINYRFRTELPIQDVLRDCARAIQFLRSKAEAFNFDKTRVAAFGGSAGAGTSLWLAFHDDLADPGNPDPVLRESSRISAAGATACQATYDILQWPKVLGDETVMRFSKESDWPSFYGLKSQEELYGPAGRKIRADVDMLGLITKDDAPVFLASDNRHDALQNKGDVNHSAKHAVAIKNRCDEVGVSAILKISGSMTGDSLKQTPVEFLLGQLGATPQVNE